MSKDISTPEYYIQQRIIAETYGITDNHAGCYITHYPCDLCVDCPKAARCIGIRESERDGV